jgi:trehalose 6-phosphate synthase
VLSRFAGAAEELDEAVLVNLYVFADVAEGLATALAMPLEERRARHAALYHALTANDINSWADKFLTALTRPHNLSGWLRQVGSRAAT